MPNRIPDLLAVWREALRVLDHGVGDDSERAALAEHIEGLRRMYQQLTDQHAPETEAMHAEAAQLIERTRSIVAGIKPSVSSIDLEDAG